MVALSDGDRESATAVASPPALSKSQLDQILYTWNDTRVEFPNVCVHELFEQQVGRHPDSVAVVFEGRRLTYRELNQRANQVAHFLRKHGVGPESLVGVSLTRRPELVVGLLGVWKAGGAYVPLDPVTAAMAKYWLTEREFHIADECVQLHGGYGYMVEYPIARMWADCRVQRIYAGTNEIMKEMIAWSL